MLGLEMVAKRARSLMILSGVLTLASTSSSIVRAQEGTPGGHSKTLSNSTRRVVFDTNAFVGTGLAMPHWDNGYLVSRQVENFDPETANVKLFDQSGAEARSVKIWFPDSTRVLVYSASATSDGRVLVSGRADDAKGDAASFVALVNQSGKMTEVIQTDGFVPATTCWAPGGGVWSFGGTGYDVHSQPKPGDTLRHFDFKRGELSSFISRSSFLKGLRPGPEVHAYIQCGQDEVMAYSSSAQLYIEMK